ncbi:hypothetical protein [Bacillus solimangrovi]|nr:hypothetical protein [Bacillus solimangrovi]
MTPRKRTIENKDERMIVNQLLNFARLFVLSFKPNFPNIKEVAASDQSM